MAEPYGPFLSERRKPAQKKRAAQKPPPPLPDLSGLASTRGNGKPADVPVVLWTAITKAATKYGVTPQVLAGIWRVESGSTYPNPNVNSSGYGGLFGTTNWNAPTQDQADMAAQILRDLIAKKGNLHDALLAYSGGGYSTVPGVTVPRTPAQKAADAAAEAQAKAASSAYIGATTDLSVLKSEAVAQAKATAHFSDPWVTLQRGKGGQVVGFGQAFGVNPPKGVLMIGGQPATQSLFNSVWGANYEGTFEAYTGRTPTAQDQADILSRGLSVYALRNELSKQPGFTSSPVYKETAAGINASAKQMLGTAPPPDLVRKAIAENWDAATLQANIRALPAYTKGPEFQQNFTAASDAYKSIYGLPNKLQNDWLKSHVIQGWTPDEIASKLRSDPAYKYSPEYATKAINFLDMIGMYTGTSAVLSPAMPQAVKQASKGFPLGPLPNAFQVGESGQ